MKSMRGRGVIAVALVALVVLAGAYPACAGSGRNPHRLQAILEGRPVRITLEPVPVKPRADFRQWRLEVRDARGALLWRSAPDFDDYYAGTYVLEMVGDVDGDGRDELVIQAPVSDVRAETFAIYRWQGGAFTHVRGGTLVQDAQDTEWFGFSRRQTGTGLWIHKFLRARRGVVVAEVRRVVPPPQSWRTRVGEFRGDGKGFRLVRWLDPPE